MDKNEIVKLEQAYLLREAKNKNKLFKVIKTSYGNFLVCKN